MNLRKSIISFLTLFFSFFFYLNVRAEQGQLEIVDIGHGVLAHKQVQDSMRENHISAEDVIDAYKAAMSNRETEGSIISSTKEHFAIYVNTDKKVILSILIRQNRGE